MIGTKMEGGTRVRAFGFLLVALVIVMLLAAKPAHAARFEVNSTGDAGDNNPGNGTCATQPFQVGTEPECTLRAAIEEANANNNPAIIDGIHFRLGGSGVRIISPSASLPTITEPVFIDGYTQGDATSNTLAVGNNARLRVRLDGINTVGLSRGIVITADRCVVRGLSITNFPGNGIDIAGADNNFVEGNFIGITPGGKDQGNGNGLSIRNASGNTVGGKFPRDRNVISGNGPREQLSGTGVAISGTGTIGNKVIGNYIGTTKSGTGDLGNSGWGIFLGSGANLVGDNDPSDGLTNAANVIAFNGLDGVNVSGNASTGNSILSNSIFSNFTLGIHLGPNSHDGVGDPDTGPNNLQNYPVISSARTGGTATTIKGTLESTRNETFTLQFFKNPESTKEEGKKFIRRKTVTTDASGRSSFTFKTRKVKAGLFVTATATKNSTGDTSEFSAPKKVRG